MVIKGRTAKADNLDRVKESAKEVRPTLLAHSKRLKDNATKQEDLRQWQTTTQI
jgi:hypothetical protein